ncbi:hypothetical protein SAMN05216364_10821 [Porphyromonadaceae bacterium KHP3R9]|jgi:hypothetical protein|nr:hypothetical protein SAMN05216364_10784 [Porphyromonadaceae bacterium KHP3R9]SFU70716.1 hypothetical protein SAMN05216364_10821 [Porphyromonadaceae bacterium KHP3R9]
MLTQITDIHYIYILNTCNIESALKTPFFQITEKRSFAGKM